MESALLLIIGLETSTIPEKERDNRYSHFCELVTYFHSTKVNLYKESGLDNHKFSFGTIYDFVYGGWKDFIHKKSLKGISQKTYQMMASSLMQHPSLGAEITEYDWNQKQHLKASYGLCPDAKASSYVTDKLSWQNERAKYYAANQSYIWEKDDDDFLPNRSLSDLILEQEIEKHGKKDIYDEELSKKTPNALAVVFHEKVMSGKGNSLAAYTQEIGSRICEANYYRYEEELTRKEQQIAKSLRKIYSLINREGKKQYISLDFRHGMMEFHDEQGIHLGEFRFTGIKNSDAEASHDLKSI